MGAGNPLPVVVPLRKSARQVHYRAPGPSMGSLPLELQEGIAESRVAGRTRIRGAKREHAKADPYRIISPRSWLQNDPASFCERTREARREGRADEGTRVHLPRARRFIPGRSELEQGAEVAVERTEGNMYVNLFAVRGPPAQLRLALEPRGP